MQTAHALFLALLFLGIHGNTTVKITSPDEPQVVLACKEFEVRGECSSSTANLVWISDLEGPIGEGSKAKLHLPPGLHQIYLIAVEDNNVTTSSNLTILAQPANTDSVESYFEGFSYCLLHAKESHLQWWIDAIPYHLIEGGLLNHKHNPSAIHAITGNRRLTVGLNVNAVHTNLRQDPANLDHMEYMGNNIADPEYEGALQNMGAFMGIRLYLNSTYSVVTWFRDKDWEKQPMQQYSSDESAVVLTRFSNKHYGIIVEQQDYVWSENDVFVRDVNVTFQNNNYKSAEVLYYVNLAPCTFKMKGASLTDWMWDFMNDYAALYDNTTHSIVHFRPNIPNYESLLEFGLQNPVASTPLNILQKNINQFIQTLDEQYPAGGAYFAIGVNNSVSAGKTQFCTYPDNNNGTLPVLETCSPYTLGRASAVVSTEIIPKYSQQIQFLLASGNTSKAAQERLSLAQNQSSKLQDTEKYWQSWMDKIILPNTNDTDVLRIFKRGVIVILSSFSEYGALVASVDSDLPYGHDWPRDGSFLNLFLDIIGLSDLVTDHMKFYAKCQRKKDNIFSGSYSMNFFFDCLDGGPVPLEIDEAGLASWSMWTHYIFLNQTNTKNAHEYLKDIYPYINNTASFLLRWQSNVTNLPLPANVDDVLVPTVNIQGSVAAWMGLYAASLAGDELNIDVQAFTNSSERMKQAILSTYSDDDNEDGRCTFGMSDNQPIRGATWFLWPALLAPNSSCALDQANALMNSTATFFEKINGQYGYIAEQLVSIAHVYNQTETGRAVLQETLDVFVNFLPTHSTGHYAEFYEIIGDGDKKDARNLNDIPHCWEHALTNMLALKLYGPWPSFYPY